MPEIRAAGSVPDGALRDFYAAAFPERAAFLSEHWRWLYRSGRYAGIEPLVLFEGGQVMGHAGCIPVTLARLGKTAPAIWFVDFALRTEIQGRGLGKTLARAWMDQCPDRITAFNAPSYRIFKGHGWRERADGGVRYLPFEPSAPLRRRFGPPGAALGALLGAPLRAFLRSRVSGAPALEISPIPDDAAALAARLDDASGGVRLVRDADWMRWRLLENPRRDEHRLASAGGVSAVFRLFTSLGRRRAHLLHVGPGPDAARAGLVAGFARWALEQGADDAWFATNDEALLAAAAPVLRRRRELGFVWHSDDPAVVAALNNPLPSQGLDNDHDLMFP